MDRVRVELVAPLRLDELRREAARQRLLAAAAPSELRSLTADLGRLLIRAGSRLEALGTPRPAPPLALLADPRHGRVG